MSLQNLFCEQLACRKIVGEKVNEAAILAKNLPFLPGEFLRKLDELEVSRRLLQSNVSWHFRKATMLQNVCLGESGLAQMALAPFRRLLKNPHMSRCCQFSEDRKEPCAGRSRSATDKLGDIARAENWRNPEGMSSLGHHGRVRGPFPSRASLLSHSPFRGCSFVPPPISAPKNSRVTCVGFSTVS